MDGRRSFETSSGALPLQHRSPQKLPKLQTSLAVSTDTPQTSKEPKRSHHHNPLHRHQHSRSHKQARDVIQSAIQLHPPSSFGELLRQGTRSGAHSRDSSIDASRRPSTGIVEPDLSTGVDSVNVISEEDVAREKQRGKLRDEELRTSLQALSEKSLDTTRKLDDTYYSILERVAILRASVGGLQELSSLTKELQHNLQINSEEIEDDVQGQIDTFHDFEKLRQGVDGVMSRMQAVKDKCTSLNTRLATANKRVDVRERIEAARQRNSTKNTRIFLWTGLMLVLGLLATIALYQAWFRSMKTLLDDSPLVNKDQFIEEAPMPKTAKDILRSARESLNTHSRNMSALWLETTPTQGPAVEPKLRLLDEL